MKTQLNQQTFPHPVSKLVCVGRNYAEHAKELNNPIPKTPLLFMKPSTTLVDMAQPFHIPQGQGDVHHELEIALLVGETLSKVTPDQAVNGIVGIGLALDLTLRDLQQTLKEKGQPWERAKAFDGACPVSGFVSPNNDAWWQNIDFSLHRNGVLQQQGNSREMLFSIPELVSNISQSFTLNTGDMVLTGTPAGVGKLEAGDELVAEMASKLTISTQVLA